MSPERPLSDDRPLPTWLASWEQDSVRDWSWRYSMGELLRMVSTISLCLGVARLLLIAGWLDWAQPFREFAPWIFPFLAVLYVMAYFGGVWKWVPTRICGWRLTLVESMLVGAVLYFSICLFGIVCLTLLLFVIALAVAGLTALFKMF